MRRLDESIVAAMAAAAGGGRRGGMASQIKVNHTHGHDYTGEDMVDLFKSDKINGLTEREVAELAWSLAGTGRCWPTSVVSDCVVWCGRGS